MSLSNPVSAKRYSVKKKSRNLGLETLILYVTLHAPGPKYVHLELLKKFANIFSKIEDIECGAELSFSGPLREPLIVCIIVEFWFQTTKFWLQTDRQTDGQTDRQADRRN